MNSHGLGRYDILEERGSTVLGRRLSARERTTGLPVVIETIERLEALPPAEQSVVREHVLRAARAARALSHPAIANLLDVEQDEGRIFLVGPSEEGTSLDTACRSGSLLPRAKAVELMAQAAEALAHAHRHGVVHGHLTPARLRQVGGGVRIDGFGLSLPGRDPLAARAATPEATAYLAPEQVRGRAVDGRADLFSLASVFYELLCGARAFPGESVQSIAYRIVNEPPTDPASLDPSIPRELAEPLLRALAQDPEERFADGDAFAAALRRANAVAGAGSGPSTVAQPDGRRLEDVPAARRAIRRTSSAPFVLAVLLLAGAVVATAWRWRDRLASVANPPPVVVSWETRVRTEPPGLEVRLDGAAVAGDVVRFASSGPFPVLTTTHLCRGAEHVLGPEDAGGEVVLVTDPAAMEVPVDRGAPGARLTHNGKAAGTVPVTLTLDLCRGNRLGLRADGYRPFDLTLPAGVMPLDVRKALYAVTMEPIPRGWLAVSSVPGIELQFYVDGRKLGGQEAEVELEEGIHSFRFKNDFHWIDEGREVIVSAGEKVEPRLGPFPLATLRVQAFPANCDVHLRRPGGEWRYFDETPAERRVTPGAYEVKVTYKSTGTSSLREVDLAEGDNPPVRVSFGNSG